MARRAWIDVSLTYVALAARTSLPLLILPLLSHRLGVAAFGLVLAAQSLATLGSMVTAFGFQLSATRELSLCKTMDQTRDVVSKVFSAQVLLSILTVGGVALACLFTPVLRNEPFQIICTVLLALVMGLYPIWYFQGRGRVARGFIIDAAGQIIALLAMWIFVHSEDDTGLALMLMVSGVTTSLILSMFLIHRDGTLRIAFSVVQAMRAVRAGVPLFLARVSSATYTISGAWFLALLSTPVQAAYYGVASKLVSAMLLTLAPIAQVMLPRASRLAVEAPDQTLGFVIKWGGVLFVIAVATSLFVRWSAAWLISFLFPPDMAAATEVTKFLTLTVIASSVSISMGTFLLIPFRRDSAVTAAAAAGAMVNFAFALGLAGSMGAQGVAIGRLCSEATIILVMAAVLVAKRPWRTAKGH